MSILKILKNKIKSTPSKSLPINLQSPIPFLTSKLISTNRHCKNPLLMCPFGFLVTKHICMPHVSWMHTYHAFSKTCYSCFFKNLVLLGHSCLGFTKTYVYIPTRRYYFIIRVRNLSRWSMQNELTIFIKL